MKNPLLTACLLLGVAAAAAPAWGTPTAGGPLSAGADVQLTPPTDARPSAVLVAASGKGSPDKSKLHARITTVVAGFVRQQTASLPGKVAYQVDELDHRLALPACTRIEAFLPAGSQLIGKTSVGVRCNESAGWSIFVPVQIRVSLDLLVSARQLPMGHTLQEQDLASLTTEISHMTGFTDPRQAVGKVLRYSIASGQVLREDMLRLPFSVTQGQIVQLVAQGSGFSINSAGAALNNASAGQTVQVRVGSSRVVGGVARAGGVVEIGP
jgi:flagella basal body P-ring formation protein FlgA